MNLLTRVDLVMGRALGKVFGLGIEFQPLELAAILRREVVFSERNTLNAAFAPNRYQIGLSPEDLVRLEPIRELIEEDLAQDLEGFIAQQRLETSGRVRVSLHPRPGLAPGKAVVDSIFEHGEPAWTD